MTADPLLRVHGLSVRCGRPEAVPLLDSVTFSLARGETLAILGESGAGKSTLARAVLRLLPNGCRVVEGSVHLDQCDLLAAGEHELRHIRGRRVALIPQEPELALNPVLRVGMQLEEVLRAHSNLDRKQRRREAMRMLARVGLAGEHIHSAYPHQLSGGQRQRIVIAQALIAGPQLLIADEPTSALDNILQAEFLQLLRELKAQLGLAILFITHNAALLSGLADRCLIMRGGKVLETGTLDDLLRNPFHSYTGTLLSVAQVNRDLRARLP